MVFKSILLITEKAVEKELEDLKVSKVSRKWNKDQLKAHTHKIKLDFIKFCFYAHVSLS